MNIDELEVNSRWYVRIGQATTLVEREVIEITELTVLLLNVNNIYSSYNKARYLFSDIEFIEAC